MIDLSKALACFFNLLSIPPVYFRQSPPRRETCGEIQKYQFWQQHSHPVELSTNEMVDQRLEYIHNNPVEAGIVLSPEDYLYSSAINYAGLPEKLLEVILI